MGKTLTDVSKCPIAHLNWDTALDVQPDFDATPSEESPADRIRVLLWGKTLRHWDEVQSTPSRLRQGCLYGL